MMDAAAEVPATADAKADSVDTGMVPEGTEEGHRNVHPCPSSPPSPHSRDHHILICYLCSTGFSLFSPLRDMHSIYCGVRAPPPILVISVCSYGWSTCLPSPLRGMS